MNFLLPIMLLPLAIFICLIMNDFRFMAHRSSEQNRLDALTLSLCHHRRGFVETHIKKTNQTLSLIRLTMEASIAGCLYPPACAAMTRLIKGLSITAQGIQQYQNARRTAYPAEVSSKKAELKNKNELKGDLTLFWSGKAVFDGFKRETLSSTRQALEKTFGAKWPRLLERSSHFERLNTFSTKYRPKVEVLGTNLSENKWKGFQKFSHQTKWRGKATSASSCKLTANEEDEYEVIRRRTYL